MKTLSLKSDWFDGFFVCVGAFWVGDVVVVVCADVDAVVVVMVMALWFTLSAL